LSYKLGGYKRINVVRLDIVIAEETVEALSSLVLEQNVYQIAKARVEALKDTLHRQQFEIKIQGVVGGKIIASERISALRKDVTAKLYGGDYTRKLKLLEKQKKGKTKMKSIGAGSVDIPQEAFLAVFKV
jgi:GTP-binding protein LepA